jgi:4-carboxymuconolactone decarboxylase
MYDAFAIEVVGPAWARRLPPLTALVGLASGPLDLEPSSGEHMNREAFEKGLKTRREVLGADYVDNSIKNADDFNMPMQELVTEYCWNEIWNRPGLERRTRSFLNLAMIAALNRPHELKLHVRGAINNGLTKQEIQEVFLQVAIYCGVPAAIDSFRVAKEVFKEMGI